MTISDLQREQKILRQVREHHLGKLFAWDNPKGILICQKHGKNFRWRKRDIENGYLVTSDVHKKDKELAEKLAVNLYRIVCVQYIQKKLDLNSDLLAEQYLERKKYNAAPSKEQNAPKEAGLNNKEDQLLPDESIRMLFRGLRTCPRVPADFFQMDSPYSQLIISFLQRENAKIIEWYLSDYQRNNEYSENLQFTTKCDLKVRSKSEVMIADSLYDAGILFHYEEWINLSGEASYPDFFIPITFSEKYCWEHFGAMDNEKYYNRTRGKILNYMDHQWLLGDNMIVTYETKKNPLSEETVEDKVQNLKKRHRQAFLDLPPDESFNMYDLASYAKCSKIWQRRE